MNAARAAAALISACLRVEALVASLLMVPALATAAPGEESGDAGAAWQPVAHCRDPPTAQGRHGPFGSQSCPPTTSPSPRHPPPRHAVPAQA